MAFLDPLIDLPKSQKIAIGVVGLVLVAGLTYFLVLSPKMLERDGLWQQNESLKTEVTNARATEATLREFRAEVAALRKRLDAAKERMPSEKEMPRLYRTLSDMATQSGINMALFQPRAPVEQAGFQEVPINVTAETGYHQLGGFFDRLGKLQRLVSLNDFRFSGINQATGSMRAEMTMATYIYRDGSAPASPAPPAAPAAPAKPPGPAPAGAGR
jgi:type IV pilus assembly protein PilO